jgi:hypothetical protein
MYALDAGARRVALEAHELEQVHLRDRETLAAGDDDQRRDDRERQRDLDAERRAQAEAALRSIVPPIFSMFESHDVHADAAARDVGDLLRRREAREEDQLQARARSCGGCSAVMSPSTTALRFTRSTSMPPPSSEISMLTCRPRGRPQRSTPSGLPRAAHSGVSMPWSHGVADDVRQRVLDRLEDRAVELGLLAVHLEADLLAARRAPGRGRRAGTCSTRCRSAACASS